MIFDIFKAKRPKSCKNCVVKSSASYLLKKKKAEEALKIIKKKRDALFSEGVEIGIPLIIEVDGIAFETRELIE